MRVSPQSGSSALRALCLTVGLTAALPSSTWAQAQGTGGLKITFGIDQGIDWKDNPNFNIPASGTETIGRTQLSFGFLSETRNQRLAINARGALEAGSGSENGLVSPSVSLSYQRDAISTALEFTAFLREADVSTLDFFNITDGLGAPVTVAISGTGTRRQTGAATKLSFGQNAPFGGNVSLGLTDSTYLGTTDPSLIDNRRINADLTLRFDLTQTTIATATFSGSRLKDEGAAAENSETLSFGLRQDRPNGVYTATLSATRTINGTRQSLRFGRNLDFPTGTLSANLGIVHTISGSTQAVGALSWQQTLVNGSLSIGLARDVTSNDANSETRVSRLSMSYSRALTQTLGLDLSAGIQDSIETFSGLSTKTTNLSASLRKQLTPDWGVTFGANHRIRDKSIAGSATSSSVFLTVGRIFEYYP